jgi:hypothetical protein
MARLICAGCGAQVSHADVVCPECDRPLLGDGATMEAPAVSPAPIPPRAGPGPPPAPERPTAGAPGLNAERCPYCRAELPQPRPLWCIECQQELPPQNGPADVPAGPPDANPYGTIRESAEPRLILAFMVKPQEGPVASAGVIELSVGQQLLLSRESADQRLAGLRGKNNVSRRHATVGLAPFGAWVRDEGSTNGTFIDGRRLAPAELVELPEGTELRLASNVYATVRLHGPGRGIDAGLG